MAIALAGVFILAPAICLAVDDDHLVPESDCPFCALLGCIVASLVGRLATLLFTTSFFADVAAGLLATNWQSFVGDHPSIRDPPPLSL
jgi:hypothetical protein